MITTVRNVLNLCFVLAITIYNTDATPVQRVLVGNKCAESTPWPCKTPGRCLSFDFICDGEYDCPDKYDEDPHLCTAKFRPAKQVLEQFLREYKDWLIPQYFGEGSPAQIATLLIENETIDDYAKVQKFTPQQLKRLKNFMVAIKDGQKVELLMNGMPPSAWNNLHTFFARIANSGFLENMSK